jgi:hypothetical protein
LCWDGVRSWRLWGQEDDALFGLTDLGNTNFGQFGSEKDPHRHLQPPWMNQNATWKQDEAVDFLPELREIRSRIMVRWGSFRWRRAEAWADDLM